MGKTSFALNIARHVSITCGKRVAFFSLEMSKEQLAARVLSSEALVRRHEAAHGRADRKTTWTRLVEAGDILSKAELYFDDSPGITVPEMKAKIRRLKDVDAVFIDYLQLMNSAKRIDNRVQEISEITRSPQDHGEGAQHPGRHARAACACRRKAAGAPPGALRPARFRLIEQDADIVLFLYRDAILCERVEIARGRRQETARECIVAKNRHGDLRSVPLHWQGEFMRFTAQEVVRREN